jgi:transposase
MRKTREILRQKWVLGRTHRAIASSVGVSAGVVGAVMTRAKEAELAGWAAVEAMSEAELDAALYRAAGSHGRATPRAEPDCAWVHRERSRPGVTLQLLHDEYRQQHPDGLGYTAFCDHYATGSPSAAS